MSADQWSLLVAVVGAGPAVFILIRSLAVYFSVKRAQTIRIQVKRDGQFVVLDSSDPADAQRILDGLLEERSRANRSSLSKDAEGE